MTRVFVLNGPNLGRLGSREPEVYGHQDLSALQVLLGANAPEGTEIVVRQTDHEAELISWLHEAVDAQTPVILNPAAFTHYSYALRDAASLVTAAGIPLIEVHISNPHAREEFRHTSVISGVATGVIAGLGFDSYLLALTAIGLPGVASKVAQDAILRKLLDPIFGFDEPLRSAVNAWVSQEPLDVFQMALTALTTDGADASRHQHIALTKALFNASDRYMQVNPRAWDADTEWSNDWKSYLASLNLTERPHRQFSYVVLGTRPYLEASKAKLASMQGQLEGGQRGGTLFTCDIAAVRSSIGGGDLDGLESPFELFELSDKKVLKVHGVPPKDGFQKEIPQRLTLHTPEERPDLIRIADEVNRHKVPFRMAGSSHGR